MVLVTDDERVIDDQAFAAVELFARAPRPVMPMPTQEQLRAVVGAMAGVLKRAMVSSEHGQLQFKLYWRALRDVELFRLQLAAEYFIKTAEWMPTPGQIRTKALAFGHPLYVAHAKAKRLSGERAQRMLRRSMMLLDQGQLTQDQLDSLPDETRKHAIARGLLVPTPEGSAVYRTREALARWEEYQRQLTNQFLVENRSPPQ